MVDYARNAGKVDGKSAVGAGANHTKRAGKLVATDKHGFLPTGAIRPLTGSKIVDGSLTLADLGSTYGPFTTTVVGDIVLGPGQAKAQLTGNFGVGVVGDLVVATLTDPLGNAVLPNTAAVLPSIVIKTTQGGAVPNLVVVNTGNSTLTIPAGSVFHWRLIAN